MDGLFAKRGKTARADATNALTRQLHSVQRLLMATAEPDANIVPVDFDQGCCNCGKLALASPRNEL
jgi:hypothetical protein